MSKGPIQVELAAAAALRRMRIALRIFTKLRLDDRNSLYFWAGLAGLLGAAVDFGLRQVSNAVLTLLSGDSHAAALAFVSLPAWQRITIPTCGGLLAGLILMGVHRFIKVTSTDYMEAIALGDGNVPVRATLARTGSAVVSFSTGAGIGLEGPQVQLAALAGSFLGRLRRMAPARRRLLVACGGAAGMAAANHAPLAGAVFIAEVILGSLAIETLGPLLVASIVGVLATSAIEAQAPLFAFTGAGVGSGSDYLLYPLIGVIAGVAAFTWIRALSFGRRTMGAIPVPIWARLTIGGLLIGLLAVIHPEATGNGAYQIRGLLAGSYAWQSIALILILRVTCTGITVGSGAVGGILTPTLFAGSAIGYLAALLASQLSPMGPVPTAPCVLAGMGAFLAASAGGTVTAVLLVFELTLRYDIILPVAVAVIAAHATARAFGRMNLYGESLRSGPHTAFDLPLADITVADLMRPTRHALGLAAPFRDIAAAFLTGGSSQLWIITTNGKLVGRIMLADVEPFLREEELASTIIAGDILHEMPPVLTPTTSLPAALEVFTKYKGEALPVTEPTTSRLLGSLGRADLFMILAELSRREQASPN